MFKACIAATLLLPIASALATDGPSPAPAPAAPAKSGCTHSGHGTLRARLRGALNLDLAWNDAEMLCEGGLRPDGRGLRVAIAGPQQSNGRRLRFVFGIDDTREGVAVKARPVNLTLIFEGEQRLFATRGSDKCMIDDLQQRRVGALGGPQRQWEISARGFCIGPATAPATGERLVVTRFDFVSEVQFDHDQSPRN